MNTKSSVRQLAVLAGTIGLACSTALADPQPRENRLQTVNPALFSFYAEGVGTFDSVVGYRWPAALGSKPEAVALGLTFKVVYQYPFENRDVLRFSVYLLPAPWDPPGTAPLLISRSLAKIDEIRVSLPVGYPDEFGLQPKPTLGILGRIIENEVPSPFGPIVGRILSLSTAFDGEGDNVQFYLLGVSAVGSHATSVTNASGSIHFNSNKR